MADSGDIVQVAVVSTPQSLSHSTTQDTFCQSVKDRIQVEWRGA
ncbi:hypothetical protein [Mycobacterium sp. 1245111.1]|nr:hypothetical protein [Mycobacterium sp. 1245111.1]